MIDGLCHLRDDDDDDDDDDQHVWAVTWLGYAMVYFRMAGGGIELQTIVPRGQHDATLIEVALNDATWAGMSPDKEVLRLRCPGFFLIIIIKKNPAFVSCFCWHVRTVG